MDLRNYAGGGGGSQTLEEEIISLLSPIEPLVMRIQSLLVWEYPHRSAVMFICVHLLFWFLATTSLSAYFLISSLSVIIFFVDTWKKKIWPEIRVPPPVPDDVDGWTPVHPRLLNVHEISHHAAQVLKSVFSMLQEWRLYRRNNPKFFSTICISSFLVLLAVGHYIPGIMLSYILVMSLLLWPCVIYHNVMKKVYLKMEPAFMWLDYNLKIKVTRSPRAGTGLTSSRTLDSRATVEEDFDEFCPTADPATTALLARAITDSEDEGGSSAIPTPQLSKQPSEEDSDIEEEDFTAGLDRMPSFDDLDQTDDEFMPNDNGSSKPMAFVPTHFGENTDSENEELNFPDISEVDMTLDRTPTSEQTPFSALASSVVSQTLSSMVEHALYGAKGDKSPTSTYGRLPGTDAQLTYTRTDAGESVDIIQQDLTLEEEDEDELALIEGELEKDFDFLDDFDPGRKTKK